MDNNIAERLNSAYRQLAEIKQKNPSVRADAQLIAVSKTKPISLITEAYLAGQRQFGENYVQELVDKASELAELTDLEWHFIGPIQSNKTRDIAKFAGWVHSIDRLKIAERLSAQRPAGMSALKVLIQVNISDEASKAGIAAAEVLPFAAKVAALPNLELAGLMAIPAPAVDNDNSQAFAAMQALSVQLQQLFPQARALSMGMSDDWQQALTFGATMIRLGTAIFGAREPQPHE
ncbi:YggS family pyridoxal phosphate-dependent enzyme [Rheinheimera riviphila]|uniref:Pyridoxal phosphate homeostasis protein n=1 Tax=Rheinheimera riviphila TaxID=1834037 RepID=A0A437QS02_9GAMM|nr:YggS family pyridoxal phosphate-dependent enzyme [Rheinheimera riviphila]RVU37239.1 YggS family pyridoxal phosphate-dependent enzyme [Rheinheimera riviphila]